MGGLLAYSGITTKVKAMESHFITDDGFREMASLESVPDAVEYLMHIPSYASIFSSLEEDKLHRGVIEQKLMLSLYDDFAKLYRFSNLSQRKFLDLYFMHYEIALLKKCLRNALGNQNFDFDLSAFQEFLDKHSKLDFAKLASCENLAELVNQLEGTPYAAILDHLSDVEEPTLFDYEMHLDLMYFKAVWKIKSRQLTKNEKKVLSQCFGSKLDMLNIQWIYRSKKYYNLSSTDIYSLLIPVQYHLKREEIIKMAEAGNLDEFYNALRSTFYGSLELTDLSDKPDLEGLYEKVLNRIHRITSQRDPYSMATLNSYLYFKELEVHKLITVIESIRYGIGADTICSYVIKN